VDFRAIFLGKSKSQFVVDFSSLYCQMFRKLTSYCMRTRVLRGAGQPARVAGTRICGAGAGTRTAFRAGAGQVRVELAAGRARDEKFFVRVNEC